MRKDDERLAAPIPGGDAFAETPAEVRPLHGILFVLACLAVAVCLLIFTVWAVILLTYTPGDPEQAGMGEIGVMMGAMAVMGAVMRVWL